MPHRGNLRHSSVEILLIEDNPGDIRLMQEAFKEGGFKGHLNIVRDGEQGLAFLHKDDPYRDSPRPAFILLDLNLPRKGGREVLAEIKREEALRQIPVVILSTSTSDADVSAAYHLHANCYIAKPVDLEKLVQVGRMIEEFWLSTAILPA